MKLIPLTQGKFAQVDDADFEWLSQWKWHFNGRYAARRDYDGVLRGTKGKMVFMHRQINKTPAGFDTDHRDGNKLNNQRYNFRTVTEHQNGMNISPWHGNKYKGFYFDKKRNVFQVRIKYMYKFIYLGHRETELDAALLYNEGALKYHGEFARLNII